MKKITFFMILKMWKIFGYLVYLFISFETHHLFEDFIFSGLLIKYLI